MQDEVEVEGPCKEKETDAHGTRSTLFFFSDFIHIYFHDYRPKMTP